MGIRHDTISNTAALAIDSFASLWRSQLLIWVFGRVADGGWRLVRACACIRDVVRGWCATTRHEEPRTYRPPNKRSPGALEGTEPPKNSHTVSYINTRAPAPYRHRSHTHTHNKPLSVKPPRQLASAMARACVFLVVLLLAAVAVAPLTTVVDAARPDVVEGRSMESSSDAPAPSPDASSPESSDAPSSSSSSD